MKTKICSNCRFEKPISEFTKDSSKKDGFCHSCKNCKKEYDKQYYTTNKTKIQEKQKYWRNQNPKKLSKQKQKYRNNNKETVKIQLQNWRNSHQKEIKNYRENHKIKMSLYSKNYGKNNRNKIQKRKNLRRKIDTVYKFSCNIRSLISKSLKCKGYSKKSHTYEILGIGYKECLDYLFTNAKLRYSDFKEEDFLKENCYQIHHIVFLQTANTEEDIIKLNHYTNLELLTLEDHKKIHSSDLLLND